MLTKQTQRPQNRDHGSLSRAKRSHDGVRLQGQPEVSDESTDDRALPAPPVTPEGGSAVAARDPNVLRHGHPVAKSEFLMDDRNTTLLGLRDREADCLAPNRARRAFIR